VLLRGCLSNQFLTASPHRRLKTQKTSRFLRELIRNDTSLQYKIELAAAGFVRNARSGSHRLLSCASQLDILNGHTRRWHNLDWHPETRMRFSRGPLYEFCGGVFSRSCNDEANGLSFVQLPSMIRNTKAKAWQHPDMGFTLRNFAIDPAQDLLVAVQDRSVP
jgi:hypothetical protein